MSEEKDLSEEIRLAVEESKKWEKILDESLNSWEKAVEEDKGYFLHDLPVWKKVMLFMSLPIGHMMVRKIGIFL